MDIIKPNLIFAQLDKIHLYVKNKWIEADENENLANYCTKLFKKINMRSAEQLGRP